MEIKKKGDAGYGKTSAGTRRPAAGSVRPRTGSVSRPSRAGSKSAGGDRKSFGDRDKSFSPRGSFSRGPKESGARGERRSPEFGRPSRAPRRDVASRGGDAAPRGGTGPRRTGAGFGPRREGSGFGSAHTAAPRRSVAPKDTPKLNLRKGDGDSGPSVQRKVLDSTRESPRREGASRPLFSKRLTTSSPSRARSAGSSDRPVLRTGSKAERPRLSDRPRSAERPRSADRPPSRERSGFSDRPRFDRPRSARPGSTRKSITLEAPSLKKKGKTSTISARTSKFDLRDSEVSSIRLNKFIASAGVSSRRKADTLISSGAVKVNGKPVTELGTQVKPYEDQITVNGEIVSIRPRHTYLLLNKPKDIITTTSDEKDRKTVMDLITTSDRVYPIGRLDRNTTGVLLMTNDGELTNRLTHPSYQVIREYHVTLDKPLNLKDARTIAEGGIDIGEGEITGPSEVSVGDKDPKDVVLLIKEGKNREVRRMFEAVGYDVEKLDRISFAGLTHRGMSRGEARSLTPAEVRKLKKLVGIVEE